jgi:hypothetical protein
LAGKAYMDDTVVARLQGGGGSVNVWGAFCHYGKLVVLERNANGVVYVVYLELLQQNLLPFAKRLVW